MDNPLQQAITAINSGDNETGKQLLNKVLETDPHNEEVWLWLITATTDPLEKHQHLRRVLQINPHNEMAKNELAHLELGNRSSQPSNPVSIAAGVVGVIGFLLLGNGLQEFLGDSNVLGLGPVIGGIILGVVAWWLVNTEDHHGCGGTIATLVIGIISLLLILNGIMGFLQSGVLGLGPEIGGIALGAVVWWLLNTENLYWST